MLTFFLIFPSVLSLNILHSIMYLIEQYSYLLSHSEFIKPYIPLILVFLSGLGFSFQTLIIKLLEENGFNGSLQCVFSRGFMQFAISSTFVYFNKERTYGLSIRIFGETTKVRWIMFLRAICGFCGIAFSFLAVERMSVGDSTVLVMLSPLFASIAGYFVLGEPWKLPEFIGTVVSLVGVTLVARPPFIFGGNSADPVGVMFALIAAVAAGAAFILVRILGTTSKMPWSNVCVAQSIGQMVLSIPSLYIIGQSFTVNIGLYNFIMIALGGFIGAWSQIAMTIGMQREKSATASAMRMSDVIFGYIWQVLFTHDKASFLSILGAILVTCSILIIVVFKPVSKDTNELSTKQYENVSTIDSSSHNPMNTIVFDDNNGVELTNISTNKSILSRWKDLFRNNFSSNQPIIILPTINISNYIISSQDYNNVNNNDNSIHSVDSNNINNDFDIENDDDFQEIKLNYS